MWRPLEVARERDVKELFTVILRSVKRTAEMTWSAFVRLRLWWLMRGGGVCFLTCGFFARLHRWSACAAGSTSLKELASVPWWARFTQRRAYPKTPTASTSGGWVHTFKAHIMHFLRSRRDPFLWRLKSVSWTGNPACCLFFFCVYDEGKKKKKKRGYDVTFAQITFHVAVPVIQVTLAHS